MNFANWLTLFASVLTFIAVIVNYKVAKDQLKATNDLALEQIKAAADDSTKKLRAEVLLKDRQIWINAFREAMEGLLTLGDPYNDTSSQDKQADRINSMTRLAHRVDLLMPVGVDHAQLSRSIVELVEAAKVQAEHASRLRAASDIVIAARRVIATESATIERAL